MTKKKPYIASVRNPTIEAVAGEMFKFTSEEQALERLQTIRDNFVISRIQEEDPDAGSIRMWIKGYEITPEEKKEGYLGNYSLIRYKQTEDGKFTLYSQKLDISLNYHPQKKRESHRHPNFGHPILRAVRKNIVYHDIEEPRALLEKLHEEYPEVSIPSNNKLYIMIYSRGKEGGNPIQKYILEIELYKEWTEAENSEEVTAETQKQGGYVISCKKNTYQPKEKLPHQKTAEEASGEGEGEEPRVKGYFTSLVELKKKK